MTPRTSLTSSFRTLSIRIRPSHPARSPLTTHRAFASKSTDLPISKDGQGPNQETLPSVSEEAISMDNARGQSGPDLSQGTPIQEVAARDPGAFDKLPKDMKEAIKNDKSKGSGEGVPSGKRQFSTTAWRRDLQLNAQPGQELEALVLAGRNGAQHTSTMGGEGVALDMQSEVLPAMKPEDVYTRRYPAIVEQLVGLMQQHGKKGTAQKNVALILNILRTSPPPKIRADRPLLPGHPPPSWLPLNPLTYLTLAIDSLAPVIRLRAQKGAAGGGASLMIPVPLAVRQRRRTAMMWIIDAASKRKDKTFPHRVADQLIAVVEGRSSLWERRITLHKLGVASRSNVAFSSRRRTRTRGL